LLSACSASALGACYGVAIRHRMQRGLDMKTAMFAAAVAVSMTPAFAEVFAVGGVKGDSAGRTVLTTEPCNQKIDNFSLGTSKATTTGMRRAFYYTGSGMTNEGCWKHEAGTILLVWPTENVMRRFPVKNFKIEAASVAPSWDSVK
jgi:hypothetical protein